MMLKKATQLKQEPKLIGPLPEAPGIEAKDGRESPDILFFGRKIAQQSAEHAGPREQQHGRQFPMVPVSDGRNRNQDAGKQSGDVAAHHSGQQAALQAKIHGVVLHVIQNTKEDTASVHYREH